MKKKLFFTFACAMALMAGFVSCTNEDFEELAPVAEMQKSAMTRAVGDEITMEDAKARMAELNEKYDANVFLNEDLPASKFDDAFFLCIENILRKDLGLEPIEEILTSYSICDDSEIDLLPTVLTSNGRMIESQIPDIVEEEDFDSVYSKTLVFDTYGKRRKNGESISPFLEHTFLIKYHFYFGKFSRLDFISLSDNTTIKPTMLPDDYKDLPISELKQILSQYPINYVDGTFYLQGVIDNTKDNPETAEDYDFNYTFRITINDVRVDVVANHISGALAFNVLD